jgi:hypothetical protein
MKREKGDERERKSYDYIHKYIEIKGRFEDPILLLGHWYFRFCIIGWW